MISLQPKPALRAEPDSVVIFGPPKIGKNTLLVGLPNHYVFELQPKGMDAITGGVYDYYLTWQALDAGIAEFRALPPAQRPRFVCIDHMGILEEFSFTKAFDEYKKMHPGTKAQTMNELITTMPNNTGWYLPRAQFTGYLKAFAEISETLIITGHVKPKSIDDNVKEADLGDMDLIGKNSRILAGSFQVIGRLLSGKDGVLTMSTRNVSNGSQAITAGCNFAYLADRDIVLSKRNPDLSVTTLWHEVFPSLKPGTEPAKQTPA